jgi:magnesium-transporting ATPase (P-type)
MKEKPKRRDEPILNAYMVNRIAFLGLFTVALLSAFLLMPDILAHFRGDGSNIYVLTAFFALFIFTGVFNCFNVRAEGLDPLRGIAKNPCFLLIMSGVCFIQILFTYLGGDILRTAPLLASELGYTMALGLLVFPAEVIRKIIWRISGKKGGY